MTHLLAGNKLSLRRPALAAAALGLLALTAACGSGKAPSGTAAPPTDMARYVQTWGTDYDHTTCAQWNAKMTDTQRWTAAFEMLRDNRGGDAAISTMPADALIGRYKTDVNTRCSGASAAQTAISDAAGDAYLAGRTAYRQ